MAVLGDTNASHQRYIFLFLLRSDILFCYSVIADVLMVNRIFSFFATEPNLTARTSETAFLMS